MYFLQIAQAPIVVQMGDEVLTIPKYPMNEVVTWGAEIQAAMEAKVTNGLTGVRRREYLTLYPMLPPSLEEMKRMIRTPDGILRVLRFCLPQATVKSVNGGQDLPKKTVEFVDNLLMMNGAGRLGRLAWLLADLDDTSLANNPTSISDVDKEEEGQSDPLT